MERITSRNQNIGPYLFREVQVCILKIIRTDRAIEHKRSIRDDPYWTSGKNILELIELSSINKVSLVHG